MTRRARFGLGIGAAALALVAAGMYATAQDTNDSPRPEIGRRGPDGPAGRGGFLGRGGPMLRELALGRLDLSDDQQTKVRGIMESHHEELRAMAERQRTANEALRQAETADTFDEGLVRVRAAERAVVEADAAVARARLHAEISQILTPEQRTKARELRSQMEQRAGEARERMRERRQ